MVRIRYYMIVYFYVIQQIKIIVHKVQKVSYTSGIRNAPQFIHRHHYSYSPADVTMRAERSVFGKKKKKGGRRYDNSVGGKGTLNAELVSKFRDIFFLVLDCPVLDCLQEVILGHTII